jgi:hypothetical protein
MPGLSVNATDGLPLTLEPRGVIEAPAAASLSGPGLREWR